MSGPPGMPRRRLLVEADGGSRGNPGIGGYGALVRDRASGQVIAERAEPLGEVSNNVAEYRGLIAGLEMVLALAPDAEVEARLDSKLVVEQMAGRWKTRHEDMRRLALEARDVVEQIRRAGGSVGFAWVPREQNKDADALSNLAMDGETIDRVLDPPPAPSPAAPPHLGEPVRILLVRHGVTDFTTAGRLDGRGGADPGLSELGHDQARAAAAAVQRLVGSARATVLTSSLARARQTGRHIADALGVEPVEDAEWDEQGFGDWDGASVTDLMRDHAGVLARFRNDPDYTRPGGETQTDLEARVIPALDRAVARGGTVVVATHRKPILVVLSRVLHLPSESFWTLATAPASLTAIATWADGNVSVAFTNRTDHLGA